MPLGYVYISFSQFQQLQALVPHRSEVMKSLSLYYNTFVDLLDYKDKVGELLTTMDACQVHLDIVTNHLNCCKMLNFRFFNCFLSLQTLNFDLTKAYLDLVTTYTSLMILLSRVEDRKAVLGLYNAAHELTHNHK